MAISDVINNAIEANREVTKLDTDLVKNFIKSIRISNDLFTKCEEIDLSNKNGEKIDFNRIEEIANKYENMDAIINVDNTIYKENKLLTSSVHDKLGVVLVYFDGNPYTLIEMICLGLLTHNTIIFNYNGYMRGVNGLVISLVEAILEQEHLSKYRFQLIEEINSDILVNYKSIDKVVFIGVDERESKIPMIRSGYKSYDLYVESLRHQDVIEQILKSGVDINLYLQEGLNLNYANTEIVQDLDEAIAKINFEGGKYCSAIFSDDANNGSIFLKEVKSTTVMYNTSPTLERALDIKQEDLLKIKNIVMPDNIKLDGKRIEV